LLAGDSLRRIAARLGRAVSTISREVAWNGPRDAYRAWRAERTAARRARRPKLSKLAIHSRLCREVERRLLERWSPQQIAARLVRDYPDDLEMRVSHETIYRSLYVQARGALRKELTTCLRTGRTQRCSHKRTEHSGTGRDGKIGRLGALENPVNVARGSSKILRHAAPIGHQAAFQGEFSLRVHPGKSLPRRQGDDSRALAPQEGIGYGEHRGARTPDGAAETAAEFLDVRGRN
jgi:hypothetical protein